MKEEIKEILDFKENADYKKLSVDEIKILEDYITNLQERNNNLEEDFKRHIDRINELTERSDNLQEENKKVHKELDYADNYNIYLISKIDKAIENIDLVIELIKQQPTEDDTWILNRLNGFKFILNGGDKE